MSKKAKNDPDNYSKMCIPHESEDAANKAILAFYEKVEQARNQHKISDVLIVIEDNVRYTDGSVGRVMTHAHLGFTLKALPMAAYAFGQLEKDQKKDISRLLNLEE